MNNSTANKIMKAIAETRNGQMTMDELITKVEQLNAEALSA